MQHHPTKQKEHHYSSPKDPFILFCPALHHPDRVTTYPQRISHTIQSSLCPLENLPLFPQIRQHSTSTVQKLIELAVCIGEEGLFAQRMRLPVRIARASPKTESLSPIARTWCLWLSRLCVGVFRCWGIVWSAAEELVTFRMGLLVKS